MLIKIYLFLIFVIFSLSFVKGVRPKIARDYNQELPDIRRTRPSAKPNLESGVDNTAKRNETIEFPQSRVGNINFKSDSTNKSTDKIEFPETRSAIVTKKSKNTRTGRPENKPIHKRVTRQTNFEHPDCANCLSEKYMKHYYAKGCKPIQEGVICEKPCPKYFECPEEQRKPSIQGCEYNGKIYDVNEQIPNPNECLHCRCSNLSKPTITCAVSECFGSWRPLNDSCYKVHEEGRCCSRIQCLDDQQLREVKTCLYDGKSYKFGEKIYPKEDDCLSCICGEKWDQSDPLKSEACKRRECDFELETKLKGNEGCVPIYHENTCCPVDYYCPTPKTWKCIFDGKQYEIGEKLDTKNNCIDCTCRVPPEFTCIRRKCDPAPIDTDCTPIYEANKCCPTYSCTGNATEATGRQSKVVANIDIPTSGGHKPPVPCPPFIPEGLACAGTNCTTIIDSNGCQACSCEVPCPDLECNHPCHVFATTPGQCPQCSCP